MMDTSFKRNPEADKMIEAIERWARDVFLFVDETLGMKPSEPVDELRGKVIKYKDAFDVEREVILFDNDGRLVYHDLEFYTIAMFKNQSKEAFKLYRGKCLTWQQTVILEAYNRAVNTFEKDSYDERLRWITVRSGHGIGKTATMSIISLHFLLCFFGAQIGATANSESQLKDIFLKELYFWKDRLPKALKSQIEILDDIVRVVGDKDWFLRARVSRPEKPEALAGLHGKYVLIEADEASGIADMTYEVMKGALTGDNFIVIYFSNPTRTEGEFYDSHKKGSNFTRLKFSSRHSPIVKDGYVAKWEEDYGKNSDEVKIRVEGEFANVADMDEKGWIPLFSNVLINFEPERGQIINRAIIGVDPAGKGRDRSIIDVRDSIYLKEVLNEKTSTAPDLARKIETIRDAYNSTSGDIGIDGFGVGAEVVANVQTKFGEAVTAILADKPREGTELQYHSYKAELAWLFRGWCAKGGIIITNNPNDWMRELEKIKYKRDRQGRIQLMPKEEFKKEYGFSPDRFDAGCYTFFKELPNMPVKLTKNETEIVDMQAFIKRVAEARPSEEYSSM